MHLWYDRFFLFSNMTAIAVKFYIPVLIYTHLVVVYGENFVEQWAPMGLLGLVVSLNVVRANRISHVPRSICSNMVAVSRNNGLFTLSPPNKLSSAKFLVCFSFKSASMSLGKNVVWVSNSLDLGETPIYSASYPDPSCLHMGLWSRSAEYWLIWLWSA